MSNKENKDQKRKIRKWTVEENISILQYLVDTIKNGYEIEKPNAAEFYKKLIQKTNLTNTKPDLVKNKVRNFRNNYLEALFWENETGQGIQENDGETTFKAVKNKKYPYSDLYKEIWGARLNIVPPKVSEGNQIGRPGDENSDSQNDTQVDINAGGNMTDEEAPYSEYENDICLVEDVEAPPKKKNVVTKATTPAIDRASKRLLDGLAKDIEATTSKGAFLAIMKESSESAEKKLRLEDDKLEFEKHKFSETQRQNERKMEAEFQFKDKEMQIRLQELVVEKLKWKALLARNQQGADGDIF